MTLQLIQGGSFTSNGNGQYITLSGGANYFKTFNLTQAAAATNGTGFEYEWYLNQTALGAATQWSFQSTGATTVGAIASGGFVYSPGANLPVYPVQTGTVITAAGPAVASATNTLVNGDRVRLSGMTAMKQISGLVATVSSVSGSAFTLAGLNSTGFSAETAFKFQKIGPFEPVLPEYAQITNISNAIQGVVTISAIADYAVGMKIRLDNTSNYGMSAIEGAEATILAVGAFTTYGTYTLTTDLNTTGAGTWTWPTSTLSVNSPRFATIAPDGQKAYYDLIANVQYGYNVQQAPFRSAYPAPTMFLSPGANGPGGQNADIIEWQSFRYS
jgi:hypothetical protein